MTILDLSGNSDLDVNLTSTFSQLSVLMMSFCEIKRIPDIIGHCTWIKILDLSFNDIETISETALDCLKSLEVLNLSHNRLMALPNDFDSPQLRRLDLSMNPLTEIPELMLQSVKSSLKFLDVSNCRIKGEIPESICDLRCLTVLNISFNFFIGGIPENFCMLEHLTDLDIRGNCFGQSFHEEEESSVFEVLSKCPDLQVIRADGNRLRWIGRFKEGALNRSGLCDSVFEDGNTLISHERCLEFPNLRILSVSNQECLEGSARPMVALLSNIGATLTSLNLSNSGLEKLPCKFFQQIIGLEHLDLSENYLRELPSFTLRSSLIPDQSDERNLMSGVKPLPRLLISEMTQYEGILKLKSLNVSGNLLEKLPPDLSQLSQLELLNVQRNRLSSLPVGIWNCGALITLNASLNLLTDLPDPSYSEVNNLESPITPMSGFSDDKSATKLNRLSGHSIFSTFSFASGTAPPSFSNIFSSFTRFGSSLSISELSQIKNAQGGFIPFGILPPLSYSLRNLLLGMNALDSNISTPIYYMPLLEYLDLSHNRISDLAQVLQANRHNSFLAPWYNHLRVLNLAGNLISFMPPEIGQLRSLKALYFGGNNLGSVPGEVSKLKELAILDLGSQFGGKEAGVGLRYNILNWVKSQFN